MGAGGRRSRARALALLVHLASLHLICGHSSSRLGAATLAGAHQQRPKRDGHHLQAANHSSSTNDRLTGALGYLQRFGYLSAPISGSAGAQLISEESLAGAVAGFQRFAGLNETGVVDRETWQLMQLPRCGNSDRQQPPQHHQTITPPLPPPPIAEQFTDAGNNTNRHHHLPRNNNDRTNTTASSVIMKAATAANSVATATSITNAAAAAAATASTHQNQHQSQHQQADSTQPAPSGSNRLQGPQPRQRHARHRPRLKRYALQGSKWRRQELTYRISQYPSRFNGRRHEVDAQIERAFGIWSQVAPINFVPKREGRVHIDIRFASGDHGDGDAFDGPGNTLAHAYFPQYGGDAHFDDQEYWTIDSYTGTNIFQVAAHELGHSLGLGHSNVREALMAPFYQKYKPNFKLHLDDVLAIQALYGEKPFLSAPVPVPPVGPFGPGPPSLAPPMPTTTTTTTTSTTTTSSTTAATATSTTEAPPAPPTSTTPAPDPADLPEGSRQQPAPGRRSSAGPGGPFGGFGRGGGGGGGAPRPSWAGFEPARPHFGAGGDQAPGVESNGAELPSDFGGGNGIGYGGFGGGGAGGSSGGSPEEREGAGPGSGAGGATGGQPFGGGPADLCEDQQIDAITRTDEGSSYVFKGDYYWLLTSKGLARGYPRPIQADWDGLPGQLDAALTWSDGKTFFFKGNKYWRYRNKRRDIGYPKLISVGFAGIPNDLDAAFVWSGNGRTYFFKGADYWRFDSKADPPVGAEYPRPVKVWNGVPAHLNAAFRWENNVTYFFKGPHYYRFNDKDFRVETRGRPPFPRPIGEWWFGCPAANAAQRAQPGGAGSGSGLGPRHQHRQAASDSSNLAPSSFLAANHHHNHNHRQPHHYQQHDQHNQQHHQNQHPATAPADQEVDWSFFANERGHVQAGGAEAAIIPRPTAQQIPGTHISDQLWPNTSETEANLDPAAAFAGAEMPSLRPLPAAMAPLPTTRTSPPSKPPPHQGGPAILNDESPEPLATDHHDNHPPQVAAAAAAAAAAANPSFPSEGALDVPLPNANGWRPRISLRRSSTGVGPPPSSGAASSPARARAGLGTTILEAVVAATCVLVALLERPRALGHR